MKFIFIFSFLVSSFYCFSQNNKLDSLNNLLQKANSTDEKFNLNSALGEAYLVEMNFEKAEECANRILEINNDKNKYYVTAYHLLGRIYLRNGEVDKGKKVYSLSIGKQKSAQKIDKEKLAWQLYNYGNFLKNIGKYAEAITYFDKSHAIQKGLGNLGKQGDCLLNSGAMYLYIGKNEEAEDLLTKAYKIAVEVKDTSSLNTITTNMASVYEIKGDYKQALNQLQLSETFASNTFDLAYIYGNKGNLYFYLGKVDSAVYAYQKASEYFLENGRELESGMVLMELGVIFKGQKRYAQAFKMLEESAAIFKRSKNTDLLTAVLINKGDLYNETNQKDSSLTLYLYALQHAKENENLNYLGLCNQKIGVLYLNQKEYKIALSHTKNALTFFQKTTDKRLLAETYNTLAEIYVQTKNYNLAEESIHKAVELSNDIDHLRLKSIIYNNYVNVFSKKMNAPEIYFYHTEQIKILDSLKREKNSKVVEELYAQYQLKEKEDSLEMVNVELQNQQIISDSQKNKLILLALFAVGMIAFLTFVIISRKKIREKNTENELLLGEIHHRVKNNLQVISSLLSLQERNISDEKAKSAILEGKERVQSMGLIHKLLYQKNNFAGIEMKEYVEKLAEGLLESFGKSKEDLIVNVDFDRINLDVDTAIPVGLMINELVVNSLKYAFNDTNNSILSIRIKEKEKQLILEVEDNGGGKVEDVNTSNSFGMKLVRSLSRQLSGTFDIEKKEGLHFTICMNDYKIID